MTRSTTIAAVLAAAALVFAGAPASAQRQLSAPPENHVTLGATLGIYPTGGGFGLGDQALDYQGVHVDALRLGLSQRVARGFRMELNLLFGFSVLADPGYVGTTAGRDAEGSNAVGWHWGFGLTGYYRFPVGVTLGVGAEITFGFGEFLDATFFRLLPGVGFEFNGPLDPWFLHLRWVTGITLLAGLEELNTAPRSNLTSTGLQVVYGF